ncbi:MAG: sensor histidine kinase [Rhodomicrobiaceae bacterium]
MSETFEWNSRILIFAPLQADQHELSKAASSREQHVRIVEPDRLREELEHGLGVLILTEEALGPATTQLLQDWADQQPDWGAPPILILLRDSSRPPLALRSLLTYSGHSQPSIMLLNRPTPPEVLQNAISTALQTRQQQIRIRDQMDELEQNRQRMEMLAHELQHRAKNNLVRLHSILRQTWRNTATPEQFISRFEERLLALGRGQDLLSRNQWLGAELHELVTSEIAAMCEDPDQQLSADGPSLILTANAGLGLHLVFHELATNAAKYGSLSVKGGTVHVRWARMERDGRDYLHLTWKELGGPPVKPPDRNGFGSRLIDLALTRELSGEARLEYPVDGFHCELFVPLEQILVEDSA